MLDHLKVLKDYSDVPTTWVLPAIGLQDKWLRRHALRYVNLFKVDLIVHRRVYVERVSSRASFYLNWKTF